MPELLQGTGLRRVSDSLQLARDWRAAAITQLKGRACYGGLDLSTRRDLTAFNLLFPFYEEPRRYVTLPYFFLPQENLDKRVKKDRISYDVWSEDCTCGAKEFDESCDAFLHLTPGNTIDYRFMRKVIKHTASLFSIQEIGYDPYNASHIVTELAEEDGMVMVEIRQGTQTLSAPTKELIEVLIPGRTIEHGGNPVLAWNAGNVAVKFDPNGNMRPDKEASGERIDGIAALIDSLVRAMPSDDPKSVYEERGVITV